MNIGDLAGHHAPLTATWTFTATANVGADVLDPGGLGTIAIVSENEGVHAFPIVSYEDRSSGTGVLRVLQYAGGDAWTPLGPGALNLDPEFANFGTRSALALLANGDVMVAWNETVVGHGTPASTDLAVRHLHGPASEAPVTLDVELERSVGSLAMAGSPGTNPAIAWIESTTPDAPPGTPKLYVKQWTGTGATWTLLGGSAMAVTSGTYPSSCTLVTGADGRPVVAWGEQAAGAPDHVRIARYDGSAWQSMGDATSFVGSVPQLAVDRHGTVWLLYVDEHLPPPANAPNQLTLSFQRWNGTAWVSEVSPLTTAQGTARQLTLDATDHPVLFTTPVLDALRWNGHAWSMLAGTSTSRLAADLTFVAATLEADGSYAIATVFADTHEPGTPARDGLRVVRVAH